MTLALLVGIYLGVAVIVTLVGVSRVQEALEWLVETFRERDRHRWLVLLALLGAPLLLPLVLLDNYLSWRSRRRWERENGRPWR